MLKNLLEVPMHHQYEQPCNALAIEKSVVTVYLERAYFPEKFKDRVVGNKRVEIVIGTKPD